MIAYPAQSDPNQQYATSNDNTIDGDATNEISSYVAAPNQVAGLAPYQYYPEFNPAAYSVQSGLNPGEFDVQSGFNGYLVPHLPAKAVVNEEPASDDGSLASLLTPLLSNTFGDVIPSATRSIGPLVGRTVAYLFGMMSLTVLGGGLTTLICTFTPICTISFALPFFGLRRFGAERLYGQNEEKADIQEGIHIINKAMQKLGSAQNADDEKSGAAKTGDMKTAPAKSVSNTKSADQAKVLDQMNKAIEKTVQHVQSIRQSAEATAEQTTGAAKLLETNTNTENYPTDIDIRKP